jgi:multidrug efflux pump subunit AcrB
LNIDETKSSAALLNSDLVGLNLRSALQGFRAGQLNLGGEEVDILIRLDENKVNAIADIENFEIVNSQGQLVPLSRVAKIKKQDAPEFRKNYNFKRTVTITAEVEPAIVTSQQINAKMQAYVTPLAEKNPDVTIKFGGEEESTNESLTSLAFALVMSLIGIFATLVFTFKSFTKPFLILTSIPLGLIGVCYAFIFDQRPLSFIAFIGIVGLSGVVINSAIILVDYIEELRSQNGQALSLPDILVKASRERFRAVLATGLTTVVGLLPAAWGIGGYDSLLVPMTLALSWGMILGTVLTLMWIPATYLILENFRSRVRDFLKS